MPKKKVATESFVSEHKVERKTSSQKLASSAVVQAHPSTLSKRRTRSKKRVLSQKLPIPPQRTKVRSMTSSLALLGISVVVSGFLMVFIGTKFTLTYIVDASAQATASRDVALAEKNIPIASFPVGVNPEEKTITENPSVDTFFNEHIASRSIASRTNTNWFERLLGKLTLISLYQNLASPTGRILVIAAGERKEEVAAHFSKILRWNTTQTNEFLSNITDTDPQLAEGKFAPATYVVSRTATPQDITKLVHENFNKDILSRYPEEVATQVPLEDTLIIASLLEREAYDFEDMRYISGIIWNRLFVDMNLQIDATLQYAKGTHDTKNWWPRVVPKDKYIDSPYNTYKHEGLPPAPIANPSLDAILAALNPRKTECMYYFHDAKGGFHCSVTYEEHVKSLKEYYGKGK